MKLKWRWHDCFLPAIAVAVSIMHGSPFLGIGALMVGISFGLQGAVRGYYDDPVPDEKVWWRWERK